MPADGTLAARSRAKIRHVRFKGSYIKSTRFHGLEESGAWPARWSQMGHSLPDGGSSKSGHVRYAPKAEVSSEH